MEVGRCFLSSAVDCGEDSFDGTEILNNDSVKVAAAAAAARNNSPTSETLSESNLSEDKKTPREVICIDSKRRHKYYKVRRRRVRKMSVSRRRSCAAPGTSSVFAVMARIVKYVFHRCFTFLIRVSSLTVRVNL